MLSYKQPELDSIIVGRFQLRTFYDSTLLSGREVTLLSFSKVALSLLSQQIAEYLQQEVEVPQKLQSGHLGA